MDRMNEVRESGVWDGKHFKEELDGVNEVDLIRQGENVRQLGSLLRGGLDASMSDLIESDDAKSLHEGIMSAFVAG